MHGPLCAALVPVATHCRTLSHPVFTLKVRLGQMRHVAHFGFALSQSQKKTNFFHLDKNAVLV